jgi:hypothetical protein
VTQSHDGGCLCGAVRYRVTGPLRDVTICHCSICRRTHGGAAAYTACERDHLELLAAGALRWHEQAGSERGFCSLCGGRLFWRRADRPTISIAAGTLDGATGVRTSHHIFTASAADWEHLDDGLPHHPGSTPG